jgi:hypothetical protein
VLLVSVTEPAYFTAFKDLAFSRTPSDVLTLRFHTDGGPATFTAQQAERWGTVAEVLPLEQVLPRAQELAATLAAEPHLLTRYLAVTLRQRISPQMAEAVQPGVALEGLTAADLAYQGRRRPRPEQEGTGK